MDFSHHLTCVQLGCSEYAPHTLRRCLYPHWVWAAILWAHPTTGFITKEKSLEIGFRGPSTCPNFGSWCPLRLIALDVPSFTSQTTRTTGTCRAETTSKIYFKVPGHLGFIFDGRVETCFYCEVSYGPLVGCVIGGVTESHRHSVAIATGAERRGFVTNRGRDWSVATPIPDR